MPSVCSLRHCQGNSVCPQATQRGPNCVACLHPPCLGRGGSHGLHLKGGRCLARHTHGGHRSPQNEDASGLYWQCGKRRNGRSSLRMFGHAMQMPPGCFNSKLTPTRENMLKPQIKKCEQQLMRKMCVCVCVCAVLTRA